MAEDVEDARRDRSGTHPARPSKNFAIAWKAEEHGPTLGYVVAERIAYFPLEAGGRHRAEANAAAPAFDELFAPSAGHKVVLRAVELPDGSVGDANFRVEVSSESGDNPSLG